MFSPTPVTAALAGGFSAVALPLASQWLGTGADFSIGYLLVFIALVAVPAHVGVLGARRSEALPAGTVDRALLTRSAAWLVAAAAVSVLPMVLR